MQLDKELSAMQIRNSILAVLLLVVGLLTSGCDRVGHSQAPHSVPEVAIVTVSPRSIVLTTELPGRTSPYLVAEIRPQVNGLIQKRLFTEGSDVKAGQVLYQIDPSPFKASLDSASANLVSMQKFAERARAALEASIASVTSHQATLELARTNSKRFEEAFKERAVSSNQRDQAVTEAAVAEAALRAAEAQVESDRKAIAAAEAGIQQAEAALETARIHLGYTRITAPISGRIGKSNVTVGAIVTAYQPLPLTTIQQIDPVYVDVNQSTAALLRLENRLESGHFKREKSEHNKVTLVLEDGTKYQIEGILQFRDITVEQSTGTVTLRIVFPNPDGILLPGMFVQAVVREGINKSAILVPQQAVSRDLKGNPFVFVVNSENKVEKRQLEFDRAIGNDWLVASGLTAGEQVIAEGIQKVRPGSVVKTVSFAEPDRNYSEPKKAGQPAKRSN